MFLSLNYKINASSVKEKNNINFVCFKQFKKNIFNNFNLKLFSKDTFNSLFIFTPIHLKQKRKLFTILSSPHINKKAKEQYMILIYNSLLFFFFKLNTLNLKKNYLNIIFNYFIIFFNFLICKSRKLSKNLNIFLKIFINI